MGKIEDQQMRLFYDCSLTSSSLSLMLLDWVARMCWRHEVVAPLFTLYLVASAGDESLGARTSLQR